MYLNTFIGGNVCATAKQAQERGGGQGLRLTTVARRLLNSGAVYRKYKTYVEISAGGKEYTKDFGLGYAAWAMYSLYYDHGGN
jgi:hypothetical protein